MRRVWPIPILVYLPVTVWPFPWRLQAYPGARPSWAEDREDPGFQTRMNAAAVVKAEPVLNDGCGTPEVKWNSTTIPEEGAIVYVLAADNRGRVRDSVPCRLSRR